MTSQYGWLMVKKLQLLANAALLKIKTLFLKTVIPTVDNIIKPTGVSVVIFLQ